MNVYISFIPTTPSQIQRLKHSFKILRINKMARVSKTNPFRPRGDRESGSNTEGEKKDEETGNPSSSTTSSCNSEKNTEDKKQEKSKGKRPMQAKRRNQKSTLRERIIGPGRAQGSVVKRGMGKPEAYTLRLWSKNNPRPPRKGIDVHVPLDDEPKIDDPKPKGAQDKRKRSRQTKKGNQETPLCKMISGMQRVKGTIKKRGMGKSTLRQGSKYDLRIPRKGTNVHASSELELKNGDPKLKVKVQVEEEVFQDSETDSEEVCKRIKIERHSDDGTDHDGRGAGTHRNLTSFGIEVVGK